MKYCLCVMCCAAPECGASGVGAAGYGRCSVVMTQRDPTPAPDTFVCFYATRWVCALVSVFVYARVCLYTNERGSPFICYCAGQRERDREGKRGYIHVYMRKLLHWVKKLGHKDCRWTGDGLMCMTGK